MLPFATFIDTGGLQYCSESHEKYLGKSFHPNFLAQAPALQSVALDGQLAYPKSGGVFTTISFCTKLFYQIFFNQDVFDLISFYEKNFLDYCFSKPTIPILQNHTKPT